MKINSEYKLRTVGGKNIIVSTAGMDFSGVITVNETAKFIWEILEKGAEKEDVVTALAKECQVDEKEISADVYEFIDKLIEAKIITL